MSVLERCPSYGMSVLRGFTVYLKLNLSIVCIKSAVFFSAAVITDDDEVGLGMVADGTPCGAGKVEYLYHSS